MRALFLSAYLCFSHFVKTTHVFIFFYFCDIILITVFIGGKG